MTLHEAHVDVFDGYETPEDENIYEYNEVFILSCYSEKSNIAFYTRVRGEGNTYTEALNNAYSKLSYRFSIRHHIQITEAYVDESYSIESDNKISFTNDGTIYYPLNDEVRQEFKEHEELQNMINEDHE